MAEIPVVPHDDYPLLTIVFKKFADLLELDLRTFFPGGVTIAPSVRTVERFGESERGAAGGSLFAVVAAEAWGGCGLIAVDEALVETAADVLLGDGRGGAPAAAATARGALDRALIGRLAERVVGCLERAFVEADRDMPPAGFRLRGVEAEWPSAAVAEASDPVAMAAFRVTPGRRGRAGGLAIILPYALLESARHLLLRPYRGGRSVDDRLWSDHMAASTAAAEVALYAVLDRLKVPLGAVADWRVGDVLVLEADADRPIALHGEDATGRGLGPRVAAGRLGAARGRRALRILDIEAAPTDGARKGDDA